MDVRIRLKPYLVGHSILRHKVPAAQAGQDVEPQTWPSRMRRPRHRDEIWKGTTVATTISRELNSVFSWIPWALLDVSPWILVEAESFPPPGNKWN